MRRGMTLIELLIAMTLAVLILFGASSVLGAALQARERLRESSGRTSQLRRTWEILSRDLHSAVIPPDDSGLQFGQESGGAAGASVLQFAAITGEPMLAGRQANETVLVQYAVNEDPRTGRPTLWRYETAYPVPEGAAPSMEDGDTRALPLLPGVSGVSYFFYSPGEQNWVETWQESPGLPTAVRVDIQLEESVREGEEPRLERWIFELPAAGWTNAQAEAAAAASEAEAQ